jgi:hypothetical protein
MTAYAKALTLVNGIEVINRCESVVKAAKTYEEAAAQVEGIVTSANHSLELAGQLAKELWFELKI